MPSVPPVPTSMLFVVMDVFDMQCFKNKSSLRNHVLAFALKGY